MNFITEKSKKYRPNIKAWEEFGPQFLQRAVISQNEVHYGFCIAGENDLHLLPELKDKIVLDVGCGSGENCIALSKLGAQVVGLEPSTSLFQASVDKYITSPNIFFINNQWENVKFPKTKIFDVILFIGSSEYLKLDPIFFSKLNKLTKKGSFVLLSRMHPFWTTLFLHENDPEDIRPYFENGRADHLLYGNCDNQLHRFHYGVANVIERFSQYGYCLNLLSEPEIVSIEKAPFYIQGCYEDPILLERLKKIPMTIIFKFLREW